MLDSLVSGANPLATAKYIKEKRYRKIDGLNEWIREDSDDKYSSNGELNFGKGKELYFVAEELWKENDIEETRKVYQESYDLGWAPSKRGLWLTDPKRIELYRNAAEFAKKGIRLNLDGDSDPIDAEFYTKIRDYIIYLAKNNNTRSVFTYLNGLLFDRYDSQSFKYVFEAYKNCLIYIDKTTYDENNEIRLLDKLIRSGSVPEAETLKNTRYKKTMLSGKWVKR